MADDVKADAVGDLSLDDLLAQYIAAEEAGSPPDRQELLRKHPHYADDLREFFANRDQMQRLAEPLRGGPDVSRGQPLGKVRYFGDYELLEEVAAGGMGIVYKARQRSLNRIVAVKMILKGTLAREDDVKRFRAEAEAAASLQHPAIVAIHEVGLHEGQHYFSMDYVDGHSLAELPREQPLSAHQAAEYIRDAAEAVHYAHQQGTLHRDLKPSNILIDRQGRVRITDFGLAKRIEGNSDLTLTGQILGTPSYMPPEQATSKRSLVGVASDIYSLGAVLYELLTGRPPFRGDSPAETLRQVETLDPVSLRLLNPSTPRDLETICLKCLEKEPHKRYGTSQLLADDLGHFLRGEPIVARPIGRISRVWRWCKRKPAATTAVVASVVAMIAIAIGAVMYFDAVRVGTAYRAAETARKQAEDLSSQLQTALGVAESARDAEAGLRTEKETALGKLQEAYGLLDRQRAATETAFQDSEKLQHLLQVTLAERAISDRDVGYAAELLEQIPESRRSFEWHYLKHLATYEQLVSTRLTTELHSAIPLAKSSQFLAIGKDEKLLHWDITTDAELPIPLELRSISDATCLALHANPSRIAVGTRSGRIWMGGFNSNEPIVSSNIDDQPLMDVKFNGDGTRVVALTKDEVAVVTIGSDTVHRWRNTSQTNCCVAFDPTSDQVAIGVGSRAWAATESARLSVWRYEKDELIAYPIGRGGAVSSAAFSADGRLLVCGLSTGPILGWNLVEKSSIPWELPGHLSETTAICFYENGGKLATAGSDKAIRLWDLVSRQPLAVLRRHRMGVRSLAVAADGQTLLSAGNSPAAVLWDTAARNSSSSISLGNPGRERLVSMDVAPNGAHLAVSSNSGGIFVLNIEPFEGWSWFRWLGGRGLAYGNDAAHLILGGDPPRVIDSTLKSPTAQRTSAGQRSRLTVSPDRTRVAMGTARGFAVFRIRDAALEREFPLDGGNVIDLAFLPGGDRLVVASNSSMGGASRKAASSDTKSTMSGSIVSIWDLSTGKLLSRLGECKLTIWNISVSPNGRLLAAAAGAGTRSVPGELKVWNLESGQIEHDLPGHEFPVWSVAFTPDSKRLASGGGVWTNANGNGNSELKIWDLGLGRRILDLKGHTSTVLELTFSPDGRRLYSSSEDGTVRIWPAVPIPNRPPPAAVVDIVPVERTTSGTPSMAAGSSTATKSRPTSTPAMNRGDALNQQRRWNDAITEFSRTIQQQPDHQGAWRGRAWAQFNLRRWDEAIADFREALRLQPFDAWSHAILASALRNKGESEEAIAEYEEAIQLDPLRPESRYELGLTYATNRDWEKAAGEYREAIRLKANYHEVHNALGTALARQEKFAEATSAYQDAIRLKPDFATAYNNLAWLLATCPQANLRDPGQAVAMGIRAIDLMPQNANYWNTLAAAQYRAGKWKEAIAAAERSDRLDQAGKIFGTNAVFRAMTHWQLGDQASARQWHGYAVTWAENNHIAEQDTVRSKEILRFLAELEELLKIETPLR